MQDGKCLTCTSTTLTHKPGSTVAKTSDRSKDGKRGRSRLTQCKCRSSNSIVVNNYYGGDAVRVITWSSTSEPGRGDAVVGGGRIGIGCRSRTGRGSAASNRDSVQPWQKSLGRASFSLWPLPSNVSEGTLTSLRPAESLTICLVR